MEMFEGKEGRRIYKNRKEAELLSKLASERGLETKVLKVKIEDGKSAEKMGFTVHQDISIAASKPSTGDTGWIIGRKDEIEQEEFGKAIEITEK